MTVEADGDLYSSSTTSKVVMGTTDGIEEDPNNSSNSVVWIGSTSELVVLPISPLGKPSVEVDFDITDDVKEDSYGSSIRVMEVITGTLYEVEDGKDEIVSVGSGKATSLLGFKADES